MNFWQHLLTDVSLSYRRRREPAGCGAGGPAGRVGTGFFGNCALPKVTTVDESLSQFSTAAGRQGADAGRQENCISCLRSYEIDIPASFVVTHFKEKCPDVLRFGQVDAFLDIVNMSSGLLSSIDSSMMADLEIIIVDTIGTSILQHALYVQAKDTPSAMVEKVTDLAAQLINEDVALPKIVTTELAHLAAISPTSFMCPDERSDAMEELRRLNDDASYAGVLQKLLEHAVWTAFDSAASSPSRVVQD